MVMCKWLLWVRKLFCQIIFRPEDTEPLLEAVALENTRLGVDPVSKNLLKMTANPLK